MYIMDYLRMRNKGIETYHHVAMRGARGMNIVENDRDRWDFIKLIYYLNDTFQKSQWERDLKTSQKPLFERPEYWPKRDPLVYILAFCLHDNHFHLLVKEIREGGLSQFMQRLPNSMTLRYNKNYGGSGSIFQGSYGFRLVESDSDLQNITLYIMVKNVFEKYPKGGLKGAMNNFEDAYRWALDDNFSSFADYAGERRSPIIEKDLLSEFFISPRDFKKKAKEYITWYQEREEDEDENEIFE